MKDKQEFKLPEKWCVLGNKQEVIDYSNIYGIRTYSTSDYIYHHYPSFYYHGFICTTSSQVEEDYTEITFEQFKKYVLKEEMKDEEQEYELVDFEIEDLKEGSILVSTGGKHEVQAVIGKLILSVTIDGCYPRNYTMEGLKKIGCKLQVPKPKLEKIQGFEVREYPEMPLVQVSNDDDFSDLDVIVKRLKKVSNNNLHPFFDGNYSWRYCRPVPKDKRNFIDIEEN